MIDLFTHKQIRCKYCEFEFSLIGFGSAAEIVCPMCGEDNGTLPLPEGSPQDIRLHTPQEEHINEVPNRVGMSPPVSVPCSVEHCPLLTGNASGQAVAEQLKRRIQETRKRRRTILTWTTMFQVCVLLGTTLFIAQTWLMHDDVRSVSPVVTVEIEPVTESTSETILSQKPGEQIEPAQAEAEDKITKILSTPNSESFQTLEHLGHALSPHPVSPHEGETVQDILSPPPLSSAPMISTDELGNTTPSLPLPPVDPNSIEMANALLELAKTTLAEFPAECIEQAMRAARIYEQHGHPLPKSMYWILSNAFASQAWGDPLLDSAPAIETMTLSPDSRYLLAQLRDRTVRLWDLQGSEYERSAYLLDSGSAVYVKFIFTPNLRWIIGAQKNGIIRIWDLSLPNPAAAVITLRERVPELQDVRMSPDGKWLAAFGDTPRGGTVEEKPPTGQPIHRVSYQRERFPAPDNLSPYAVLLWNLSQLEAGSVPAAMPVASASPQPVQVIRFSPNSDRLAIGQKDAVVSVYDLTARGANDEPVVLQGHQLGITQIAFAPCGTWIATGGQDNTVRLWDLTPSPSGAELATLYGHVGWISALSIDATGEYIVSGSYDRTIRIWNVHRDRLDRAVYRGPTVVLETCLGIPMSLLVTKNGDKLIALGDEGSLGIFHFPSLLEGDSEALHRSVTFRNKRLSISQCLLMGADQQFLIFSYEHLLNPSNSGIRLWSLYPYSLVQ